MRELPDIFICTAKSLLNIIEDMGDQNRMLRDDRLAK